MQYIDKSPGEGPKIVDKFLEEKWLDSEERYANADYYSFRSKKVFRKIEDFVELLLKEQSNLCCYCMKQIEASETTLEHVITHKVERGEAFEEYLMVDTLKEHVIHKDEFDRDTKIIPLEKYPHDIAYQNLIASCDSNSHCNNYRGDTFINPLIYDENIQDKVTYDLQGRVGSEEYQAELLSLGLSDGELTQYREIIYQISLKYPNISDVDNNVIEEIVLEMVTEADDDGSGLLDKFFGSPSKKDDLMAYDWFFNYYQNQDMDGRS